MQQSMVYKILMASYMTPEFGGPNLHGCLEIASQASIQYWSSLRPDAGGAVGRSVCGAPRGTTTVPIKGSKDYKRENERAKKREKKK